MSSIAIIDDNTGQSDTVKTNIEMALDEMESSLTVITAVPFANPNDYFQFIEQNDICVMILDEMLNDQANDERGPVDYKGSDLVSTLRSKLPDFPIFALTVIPTDENLKAKYSQYEDIISRKEFYEDANKYVPKFWRAAKNYLKENIDEFSQFNELTQAISGGNKDPELLKKLQALQVKLELPYSGFEDRNTWLNEYEKQIESLEELNKIIKAKLNK
ncbi:hypothetical protein [Ferruginibacter sp.]|nr:hypothetical protein [Ferruginibacter sp.]